MSSQNLQRGVLRNKLEIHRATLIGYLKVKLEAHDWHAVSDAANDIRELEAKLAVLNDEWPA